MPNPLFMKRIILMIVAALSCSSSFAQELFVDDAARDVYVSNVIETSLSKDEILTQIIAYDLLDDMVVHNDLVAGYINPVFLDYEGAGYTRMKVPLYVSNDQFVCRLTFRFKEGKYRYDAFGFKFRDSQGYTTPLYSYADSFGFDIATKLILQYLQTITTFYPLNNEW